MIKIDLITGFLGSGKTTFIRKYVKYLTDKGLKIGILENDYGAVNVDAMLLQDILGESCDLEMVAGGCDADCHRRRFKTKLIAMGMQGFDRVLVEPSGVFDMDEFFDTLHEEPLERWYKIGNVITIVDAHLELDLSERSRYILASEAANAGKILFSKTDGVDSGQIQEVTAYINKSLEEFHCTRKIDSVVMAKPWDEFNEDDYKKIENCEYVGAGIEKRYNADDVEFSSLYYMNKHMTVNQLKDCVNKTFSDEKCGNVFRIKGFMSDEDGWIELNATKKETVIKPIKEGQEIFIVIGEDLVQDEIDKYWK